MPDLEPTQCQHPGKLRSSVSLREAVQKIFFLSNFVSRKNMPIKKIEIFLHFKKKDSHFYDEKLFTVGFEPEKGFPT